MLDGQVFQTHTALAKGLRELFKRLEERLSLQRPLRVYLAGGMAVHLFHLKELTHAGLVSQDRDGRNLIYRASFEQMNDLLGYLTANCCQGKACAAPAVNPCAC